MRKKWKSDNIITLFKAINTLPLFAGVVIALLISSCRNEDKHKHIQTNKKVEFNELVKSTNHSVFSEVKTISPLRQNYSPIIKATGIISYDPQLQSTISIRFDGRIEKLYVRFNFENVAKGQRIMDIYSPEILTEQEQYIVLLNSRSSDTMLINSSRQRLRLLGLSGNQILHIESYKKAINPIPVYSSYNGHIHDIGINNGVSQGSEMNSMSSGMVRASALSNSVQVENLPSTESSALAIKEGMYLKKGQPVFSVYDVSQVLAFLNLFPTDASVVKVGDKVSIISEINPTKELVATIKYIEPVTGEASSTIRARAYIPNVQQYNLKIGSLLSAKIYVNELKGLWIPREAVINLGQKSVVFIKTGNYFSTHPVQTGMMTDSLAQIISGLEGNEHIAVNAQYLIDSESFIQSTEDE